MLQLEFLGFLGLGRRHGHIIWKTRFGSPVLGRWAVVPGFDPLMGHCGVQLLLFKTSGLAQKGTPLDPFDGLGTQQAWCYLLLQTSQEGCPAL